MTPNYLRVQQYIKHEPGSVFLEIGSERGEGSTDYLAELAESFQTKLLTVDIDQQANNRVGAATHRNIEWHLGRAGSDWCKNVWPSIAKPISFLYLDNFDWIWALDEKHAWIPGQIAEYQQRWQIEMNNENCQQEHFEQLMLLEPWLTPNAVIAMDDTLLVNGAWSGKCGPVVVYLKHRGWQIKDTVRGVIMQRVDSNT